MKDDKKNKPEDYKNEDALNSKAHEAESDENLNQEIEENNNAQSATSSELESIIALLNDEKTRRISLLADFENYKRRIESDKATFGAIANMGLIQELLEVHDDLEMALNDSELDLERAKTSMSHAQDKLTAAAASSGVVRIEVKVGDDFNKEIMEAVSAVPDEKNKNKVIAVISSAYKYANSDNILRHAKVIVGK